MRLFYSTKSFPLAFSALWKLFSALCIAAGLLLAACASPALEAGLAPPLLQPAGFGEIATDTVFVDRGTVEQVYSRRGLVRVSSIPMFFDTYGFLYTVYAFPGDSVHEGQLLARLDGTDFVTAIDRLQEDIARMSRDSAIANELFVLEIALMQLDNAQSYEIERAELVHAQDMELRALGIEDARRYLNELLEAHRHMELRAPAEGTITFLEQIDLGVWVTPVTPFMFINICDEVFIDYVGLIPHPNPLLPQVTSLVGAHRITARINGETYEIEHVRLSPQEAFQYRSHGLAIPTRFRFASGTENLPPKGSYASLMFYTVWVPDTLRIPFNALVFSTQGPYVYRYDNGRRIPTPVRIGVRSAVYFEILEGLEEGDEIIVM